MDDAGLRKARQAVAEKTMHLHFIFIIASVIISINATLLLLKFLRFYLSIVDLRLKKNIRLSVNMDTDTVNTNLIAWSLH